MIVLLIQIVLLAVVNGVPSLKTIIKNTGIGPGSYYPWLYFQVWLIMPLIVVFVRKIPIWLSFLIMLFISIIAEYIFVPIENVEHVEELYRILPARYLMIFYLHFYLKTLFFAQNTSFFLHIIKIYCIFVT